MESWLNTFFASPYWTALGWALLHSLWQGALIWALLVWVRVPNRLGGRAAILWSGLWLLTISFSLTWFFYLPSTGQGGDTADTPERLTDLIKGIYLITTAEPTEQERYAWRDWIPGLSLAWLIGLGIAALRSVLGYRRLRWLRRSGLRPAPEWAVRQLKGLAQTLGVRRNAVLALSIHVDSPLLFGYLKPVILFPVGLLNRLSPEEVQAVLLHELVHIQRHDVFWQGLQRVMETGFFYHPLVYWIGRELRQLREYSCDDRVVESCEPLTYARALLHLETFRPAVSRPLGSLGILGRRATLYDRVNRIVNTSNQTSTVMEKVSVLVMLIAMAAGYWWPQPSAELASSPVTRGTVWEASPHLPRLSIGLELDPRLRFDTLPDGSIYLDVQDPESGIITETKIKDGQIQELKIDGREIPPENFYKHQTQVERLLQEVTPSLARQRLDSLMPPSYVFSRDGRLRMGFVDSVRDRSVFFLEKELDKIGGDSGFVLTFPQKNFSPGNLPTPFKRFQLLAPDNEGFVFSWSDRDSLFFELDKGLRFFHDSLKPPIAPEVFYLKDEVWSLGGPDSARLRLEKALEGIALHRQELGLSKADLEMLKEELVVVKEALGQIKAPRILRYDDFELADPEEWITTFGWDKEKTSEGKLLWNGRPGNLEDRLERQLLEDGMIEGKRNYDLLLSDRKMKINGRRLPDTVHEKYLELYERITGNKLEGRIAISKSLQ